MSTHPENITEHSTKSLMYGQGAFDRMDESDDSAFYQTDRFVSHLDHTALTTVEALIGQLVIEKSPRILDLMAGWDSHLPDNLSAKGVVGLGLNRHELDKNARLSEQVIHDLNQDPTLPFEDNTFDVVLNTVSVDYLTDPVAVFKEAGRVLKPGGLFLVTFSNRMFPQKAVRIWRDSSEGERMLLVEDFFKQAGLFDRPTVFVSKGRPRPKDDKYAHLLSSSDPIYAVYAEKCGGDPNRTARPHITAACSEAVSPDELACNKRRVKETLACPYCGEPLKKWEVPENPFCQTWDNEFMYICFNDDCPYYVRGWDHMARNLNSSNSYRLMYNPEKDCCLPIPVPTPYALKDGIIE